jgi:AraC family ethanolamine operon transcriptional activator
VFVCTIRVLLLPQFVPRAHPFEWFLEMETANHDRIDFAVIVVEIVNGGVPALTRGRDLAAQAAQAYIERHVQEAISVKDICAAAGVSQRTLEYAFEMKFGLTPKPFLLAYRLNLVRKELRSCDPVTTKIVEIANDYEFWHMGRFAAYYRQLFDELPSETLKRINRMSS